MFCPPFPSTILEAPVTEPEFLEQLHELNGKINSVKEQAFRETVACADVQHILEKLKIKASPPPIKKNRPLPSQNTLSCFIPFFFCRP